MISLGVCQINQWQNLVAAAVILAIGILVGGGIASQVRRFGVPVAVVLTFLLGVLLPTALLEEAWPFNASEPSCGFTSDPNAWVIGATLLLPVVALVSLIGTMMLRRRSRPTR